MTEKKCKKRLNIVLSEYSKTCKNKAESLINQKRRATPYEMTPPHLPKPWKGVIRSIPQMFWITPL